MEPHPFVTAWETRDATVWEAVLAPDAVLYSPILERPFRGREEIVDLCEALFQTFGKLEVTHEFSSGDTWAFYWRAELAGRTIEGSDLIVGNDRGEITEIRVMMRPLTGVALFAAKAGPPMAARLGRWRAIAARVLGPPFRGFAAITNRAATRVVQRR